MDKNDIRELIAQYALDGHTITVRDIAFAILKNDIKESNIAYVALFGKDSSDDEIRDYVGRVEIKKLVKELNRNKDKGKRNTISKGDNREGMENDLRFMTKLLDDRKDELTAGEVASLMGKISDLRVKLNDKFSADEKEDDQRVIVNTKFNRICERYNIECYQYTKEWAMEHFGLVEKKKEEEDI